jgi:hypothetical protein
MSFGFLIVPDQRLFSTDVLRISLVSGPRPNKRTKIDRTNLTALRGDDEYYTFQAYLGNVKASLLGGTITATGRVMQDSPDELFSQVIVDGQDGNDFMRGLFIMHIPSAVTLTLPTLFKYDIKMEKDSKFTTLVSGQVEVRTEYLSSHNPTP